MDGLLYEHYEKRFDDLVQRLPSTDHASQMLDEMSPAKVCLRLRTEKPLM